MEIVAEFPIVGVGASAGGITALKSLLLDVSAKPNFALVLLQHFQPGQSSHLTDLVSTWTSMPTCEATEGLRPVCNSVYVAKPDEVLTIEQGIFRTKPAEVAPDGQELTLSTASLRALRQTTVRKRLRLCSRVRELMVQREQSA